MDLCIFTEPQQGASYDQLLAVATAAETHGFHGFFRSDHYLKMGESSGLPGPTHAWVTLAGLARETSRIRLGTLVSPVTFHDPGPLAIMVAQVDAMSEGRVDLGIGAGWYQQEHAAVGLPFPGLAERMSRFEEAVEQIVGLWTTPNGETFNHQGEYAAFVDAPALPKPVQRPHPPIIIGGGGARRTPALAARYAAEFNLPFSPLGDVTTIIARAQAACEVVKRKPEDLRFSAALVVCAGTNDDEVRRRAGAIGREPDELRENGLAGSPSELIHKIETYRTMGVSKIYLQILDLTDLDHIALIGSDILPHV